MYTRISQTAVLVGHVFLPNSYEVGYEEYTGTYAIVPKTVAQTLQTANKRLSNDININAIPYFAVSNEFGGNTVTIG